MILGKKINSLILLYYCMRKSQDLRVANMEVALDARNLAIERETSASIHIVALEGEKPRLFSIALGERVEVILQSAAHKFGLCEAWRDDGGTRS
jgi:hypothetical protein